jgi:arginine repressor
MSSSRNKRQAVTEAQRTAIYKKKHENPGITQTDIQEWTKQEFGFKVNQSTISRILKRPAEFLKETNVKKMNILYNIVCTYVY